mmetsp:Transcript_8340/g.27778  ORF Transcript_8340/g.27778 Transcript_8340/m.27778 type:complete len:211 (+) Transcript_8340:552-1184(+)
MPNGSVASSGCAPSTRPLHSKLCAALPGVLLKSPHTTMGISADAAIFSKPFSNVCTCHSFTSLSSVLAWMCVFATHRSCRFPDGSRACGWSRASKTTMSATLSFIKRFRASFFVDDPPKLSTSESAALLNSTSYFLIRVKRSFLKKIAHPSMTYVPCEKTCAVFFLYTAVYPRLPSSPRKKSSKWSLCTSCKQRISASYCTISFRMFSRL